MNCIAMNSVGDRIILIQSSTTQNKSMVLKLQYVAASSGHLGKIKLLGPISRISDSIGFVWTPGFSFLTSSQMYQFARAAITRYHGLDVFNSIHLFCHSSEAWRSKFKVFIEGLVSPEALSLACRLIHFHYSLAGSFLCAYSFLSFPFLIRTTVSFGISTHSHGFILTLCLFKGPVSKYSHILSTGMYGFNM